jgi:polar amino acid transport system substrate-binding protein
MQMSAKIYSRYARLCLFAASCWLGSVAAGESITLGAEDDWAPYSSKVDGEAKGFAVDIVREAYKSVGVEVKFVSVPYSRCMAETLDGVLLGCFDSARSGALEDNYLFHNKPLFIAQVNIFAAADSRESGLTTKSLEGKKVGVTNGYEYGGEFDSNTKVIRDVASQDEKGFSKLLEKRVPYMLAFEKVALSIFAKNPAFAGKFKVVGVVDAPGLYIAFSKKHAAAQNALDKFNQGLELIQQNGTYAAIEARWQ